MQLPLYKEDIKVDIQVSILLIFSDISWMPGVACLPSLLQDMDYPHAILP